MVTPGKGKITGQRTTHEMRSHVERLLMNVGNSGWDELDKYDSTGGGNRKEFGPSRFWLPAEVTKRIMFLDEDPYCFYEHSLWAITKRSSDRAVCLKKNKLGDECPLCDAEMWPSFTGFFSVIDMGDVKPGKKKGSVVLEGWTNDKGVTYQFGRKLLGAKRGGKDKPGVLQKLRRLSAKKGGLKGTVWDVYRSGQKVESVGDEYEYVETVPEEDWVSYLTELGANPEMLNVTPVDYSEAFPVKTVEELRAIVGATTTTSASSGEVTITSLDDDDDDDPSFDDAI